MRLDGEIVVADSRQVYERLDIATNKPSDEQRRRVRYHMIDFVDPAQSFNAAEYVQGARAAIDDIASRGRLPIVEGGTMLYVDALCDGFNLTGIPPNPTLRAELEDLEDGALRERLLAIDPDPGVDLKNPSINWAQAMKHKQKVVDKGAGGIDYLMKKRNVTVLKGTGRIAESELERAVLRLFDLSPLGIIKELNLRRPLFRPVACYGHFGRTDVEAPWEDTGRAQELLAELR